MKSLTFGEILWDIIEGTEYIGGAPYNFAAHLAKLGGESYLISAVGDDDLGRQALDYAKRHGIRSHYLKPVPDAPTGTVTVELSQGEPEYTIHEGVAWDKIGLESEALEEIRGQTWDIFYMGTLAQRSEKNRTLLAELFGAVKSRHFFYDINLRQNYYSKDIIEPSLNRATIVKLNRDEAELIGEMFGIDGTGDDQTHAARIAKLFDLETLIITRGKEGALVFHRDEFRPIPVKAVEVADAVGAGDSFSAGFMYALTHGKSPFEAAVLGGELGSFVASQRGAIPEYSSAIKERFAELD